MHHSRYMSGILMGVVTTASLSAAPLLERTGTIYRNIKNNTESKVERKDYLNVKKEVKQRKLSNSQYVKVNGFKVVGNDELSDAEINRVLSPFMGQVMTTGELYKAANALTEYYHKKGFFTANVALIEPYILKGGIIVLVVDERHLEKDGISVENNSTMIKTEIVHRLWDNTMKPGAMKQDEYERAMLLTNDLPGISAKAELYYGTDENTDNLVVTVSDTDTFNGNIDIDNFGSYFTGRTELGTTLYWNSPTGNGEEIVARFITTGKYSNYGYLDYALPVFDNGTRIGASVDYLTYELKHQTAGQGGDGTAWNANLYMKYPLVRTEDFTVEVEARYDHTELKDNNLTAQLDDTVIDKGIFKISGNRSDELLDNGITYFDLTLTTGNVKLKDEAYKQTDALTSETAGSYVKVSGSISRLQNIKGDLSSKVKVAGQWANKNLDTSEKYFLGGPYSVAGYPTGQVAGDIAAELYVDLRYDFYKMPWGGDFQVKAFYNYGWIQVLKDPKKSLDYYFSYDQNEYAKHESYNKMILQSVGVGFTQTWSQSVVLRVTVGKQIGDNEYRDIPTNNNVDYDKSDSDYRGWFELIYYF